MSNLAIDHNIETMQDYLAEKYGFNIWEDEEFINLEEGIVETIEENGHPSEPGCFSKRRIKLDYEDVDLLEKILY